jgi:Flp pilus assembly pilin Flp
MDARHKAGHDGIRKATAARIEPSGLHASFPHRPLCRSTNSLPAPPHYASPVRPGGRRVFRRAKRFCSNQSGVTALEYAVLAALLSVVIVFATNRLGFRLAAMLAATDSMALTDGESQ